MSDDVSVTITYARYQELLSKEEALEAKDNIVVRSWDGYPIAYLTFEGDAALKRIQREVRHVLDDWERDLRAGRVQDVEPAKPSWIRKFVNTLFFIKDMPA